MLKIKDGKLYGSNYSFAIPEGFNMILNWDPTGGRKLEFAADDGITRIDIYFNTGTHSAKEDLEELIEDCECTKMGDFVYVRRGMGTGVGLFYKTPVRFEEHYEERYDFKENDYRQTQIDIDINICLFGKELPFTIQEVLETPPIKSFLASISYY